MRKGLCWAFSAFLSGLFALTVFSQPNGRDMVKEQLIWRQLESMAPAAVETFKAATIALDQPDYPKAVELYQEVLKKAPDFDPVYRRLGTALMLAGHPAEGMPLLETAVKKNASPENLMSLAEFLAHPGEGKDGSATDKTRALSLAKKALAAYQGDDPSYPFEAAQLALETDQIQDFRDILKQLNSKHPDLMFTHYYNAVRAALDENWITAENEIKQAQRMGLPAEAVKKFLGSGVHLRAMAWRYFYYALGLVAVWVVSLGLLFGTGKLLSRLTLRSIETSDPNLSTSGREISLRSYYKKLINFAGFYYYISLPVVIFLVVAVAGSVIYAFLLLGRIPIKLTVILVVGTITTLYKMIQSLFIKQISVDPGRTLMPEEAPGLQALTREVAAAVGTRPIDEIRVTPGTDLAVYERGRFRERVQDRARRILILGVGVLNGFHQNAFRAVLAHEYGHFSHRDTAGGDVALRVNADMMNFAMAMAAGGQAVWWNAAFQFLRVYHLIFRRISHGATRLQEVLADRVAVRNYGAAAFEEGLRHAIRREIEFNYLASKEIQEAAEVRRDLLNLYRLPDLKGTEEERQVEEELNKAVNRPTSEEDTHPSPSERFRLANRIAAKTELSSSDLVWNLFASEETLTAEMSALINQKIRAASD